MTETERKAKALYEYRFGTGQPATRWENADPAERDRHMRYAHVVLTA